MPNDGARNVAGCYQHSRQSCESDLVVGYSRIKGVGDTSLSTSTSAVSVAGVADSQGKTGHLIVGKAGGSDVIKSVRTAGASGDAIVHTVFWEPLEVGAYLVDAA